MTTDPDTGPDPERPERRVTDKRTVANERKGRMNQALIDVLAVGIFLLLIVNIGTSAVVWHTASKARDNSREIGQLETTNVDSNRATAYRLCTRNKVDRAFAHARIRGYQIDGIPLEHRTRAQQLALEQASTLLMASEYLPILNCTPNLKGKGAVPMPISEQIKFVKAWAEGKLTGVQVGVCPGSTIGRKATPNTC
jgi:hypothetical protein